VSTAALIKKTSRWSTQKDKKLLFDSYSKKLNATIEKRDCSRAGKTKQTKNNRHGSGSSGGRKHTGSEKNKQKNDMPSSTRNQ